MNVKLSAMALVALLGITVDVTAQLITQKINPEDLHEIFEEAELVPDFFPIAPVNLLKVKFKEEEALYGNTLHHFDTYIKPEFSFNDTDDSRESDSLYTLIFFGIDVGDPEYLYWLLNNIVGDGPSKRYRSTVKYEFPDPAPYAPYSVPHRMVFLVYRQPSKKRVKFDAKKILGRYEDRASFVLKDFLDTYNFTEYPVAGNYYYTRSRQPFEMPMYISDWQKPFLDQFFEEDLKMDDRVDAAEAQQEKVAEGPSKQ